MKVIGIIVLAMAVLSVESKSSKWGIKGRRDVLLYTKDVINMCLNPEGCKDVIKFPNDNDVNEKIITFVYASDELGEESNVKAQLTNGGFGKKSAEITIEANSNDAVNFVLEVYGRQFALLEN